MMKKTGPCFLMATLGFLLLMAVWFIIPIDYDFSNVMLSGGLNFALGYELFMIAGWLLGVVRYLLAAAYVLALFAVLKNHPKRLKFMLFTGAGLVVLSLLMLLCMTQLGWFFAHFMLSFSSAMMTTGLMVIVMAFAFRIFMRKAKEDSTTGEEPTCAE